MINDKIKILNLNDINLNMNITIQKEIKNKKNNFLLLD